MPDELSNDMLEQLLRLPYEQRDQLANTLIKSLHPAGDKVSQEEWRSAWVEECNRRSAEVDSGEVAMIPADELIARLRAKHSG